MEYIMNGKWTTLIVGGIVAVLVIGAATLGAVLARPSVTQAAQANGNVVRQITVIGNGQASGTPDQASVQLGVQSNAQTARAALDDNSTKMNALIAKLKELGIDAKNIQTSNFNVSATYGDNGQTVTGYQVSNTVSVTIKDVSKASDLLDQVVSAGANSIYGINLTIADPKALESKARDAAVADARVRAEAMAKAAGGSVGEVLSISETINSPAPVPMMMAAADSAAGKAAPPVQAGEQQINAQIQIPEVVSKRIEGDWMIPSEGALLVSMGPNTRRDKGLRHVYEERLVAITASRAPDPPIVTVPSPARSKAPATP